MSDDQWVKEGEEGRCVVCTAVMETMWSQTKEEANVGSGIPLCYECHADGSFVKWLEAELETYVKSQGWPSRIENGRTLYTPPKQVAK